MIAPVVFPWPDGFAGFWGWVTPSMDVVTLLRLEEALHAVSQERLMRQLMEQLREHLE